MEICSLEKKKKIKLIKRFLIITVGLLIVLALIPATPVVADDSDGIPDDHEMFLLNTYAPTLYFKAGENFYPMDCTYMIYSSELWRWNGLVQELVDSNPTPANSWGSYDEWHYLNSTIGDYSAILANYSAMQSTIGYTVYGRVNTTVSGGYVVQYWFFYLYNDHTLNQHQGDWELFQILLDGTETPVSATCSQHNSGQTAVWADVEKTNTTHPNIYVARGSHANYFRSYQGKAPLENDEVGDDGIRITYEQAVAGPPKYSIEFMGEKGTDDFLDFEGRWGNWVNIYDSEFGFAGPDGPAQGDNAVKWDTPENWASTTMSVGSTWFILSWIFYYFLWIFLAIFGLLCLWKIAKMIKNRTSDEVPSLGTVLGGRAAFGVFLAFVTFAITALIIFQQWYVVHADIQATILSAEGDVILIDGWSGLQVNMLVGGSGLTPMFSILLPMYLLLGTSIILSILDILGAKSAKKLGNKYLISGFMFIVLLILLIVGMSQLNNIVGMLYGGTLPTEVSDVLAAISASPFGGSASITIPSIADVDLTWGFMLGGWLLIANAVVKILAGAVLKSTPENA